MAEETNLFFEVLGIAIGFAGLILLLSLIVTSASQMVQSLLGLRVRNLRNGVAYVLGEVLKIDHGKALTIAKKALRRPIKHWWGMDWIGARGVTWIKPDELVERTLEELDKYAQDPAFPDGASANGEKIKERFLVTEPHMKERFQAWMRATTAVLALLVALLFQVDSLALLRDLSENPELAAQYESTGALQAGVVDTAVHTDARSATLSLSEKASLYNLAPWPRGVEFYGDVKNWIGVLITAILLSLGAPFWFETLRKLVALRDQLRSSDLETRQVGEKK